MSKNTFFKIYTADYSEQGYEQGVNDAKNHKPKNTFTVLKIISPINYLWRFNNAFDSFSEHYHHGFVDGQRVNNHIYQEIQPTGNNMTAVDSYINQLRMLEELKILIASLKRYLITMEQQYKQQINSAENAGFMQEYTEQLKQKHQRFATKIEALTQCIERHTVKLEQQEEIIRILKDHSHNN
jgi:hypothetical protein